MSKWLYVLRLTDGKWYVGVTNDPDVRFCEHLTGFGSAWTSTFPVLEVAELRLAVDVYDEARTTKEYMRRHGIDNVRGGPWCTETVTEAMLTDTTMIERSVANACMRCGRQGHFARDCFATTSVDLHVQLVCFRCGRQGHFAQNCFATTSVKQCVRCGRQGHRASDCYASI